MFLGARRFGTSGRMASLALSSATESMSRSLGVVSVASFLRSDFRERGMPDPEGRYPCLDPSAGAASVDRVVGSSGWAALSTGVLTASLTVAARGLDSATPGGSIAVVQTFPDRQVGLGLCGCVSRRCRLGRRKFELG
jgi:hypothetical protein